jgi:hypothetical protein
VKGIHLLFFAWLSLAPRNPGSLALVNTLLLQEVLAEEKWKQAMKQEDWRGLTPSFIDM